MRLVVLAGLVVVPVAAQDRPSKDPSQGVYVRDSAAAQDKMAHAMRMQMAAEWRTAAELYQEILQDLADRVVPSQTDEQGRIFQYKSVSEAVVGQLAKWPTEGIEAYRTRYEPAAQLLLEQARRDDIPSLRRVYFLYFITDAGKQAGMRLMDLCMEAGEFSAAASIGDKLLGFHPNIRVERPPLLFRTGLAWHMAGDGVSARQRLAELQTNHRGAAGTVMGRDADLVAVLEKQFEEAPLVSMGSSSDSYRMVGGDEKRSMIPAGGGQPGVRIYGIDLPRPNIKQARDDASKQAAMQYEQAQRAGTTIGVIPAADKGHLFFQDGFNIWAVQLESGVPLAGWMQTYPGAQNGIYRLRGVTRIDSARMMNQYGVAVPAASGQFTVTVNENSVVAVMGQPTMANVYGRTLNADNIGGTRLVCLDRESGAERWCISPRDAADGSNIKGLNFSGSPLIVGESVYVMTRGAGQTQSNECHVQCYDLASGNFRWTCYIASSADGAASMMYGVRPQNEDMAHLAYSSGWVYALTNIGAVAAVDAYNGAIGWLNVYPRQSLANANMNGMIMRGAAQRTAAKPWEHNCVILSDSKVFVLPSDGLDLLVYESANGNLLRRIATKDLTTPEAPDTPRMLLGVIGDQVIVGGDKLVSCVNWAAWDPKAKHSKNPGFWRNMFTGIRGRPFVTSDCVYVPTDKALYVVNLKSGRIIQRYPKNDWPENEEPGNVVVTADHVILAGSKIVNVYTDLTATRNKLAAVIEADPSNPEPRLLCAELMFAAGDIAEASKRMDEAIEQLGGMRNMRSGGLRDRVFGDSINFVQKLTKDNKYSSADDVAAVDFFLDRAAAAAQTPSQGVNYRMVRAQFIEKIAATAYKQDLARAVQLYQEILFDAPMRIITIGVDESGGQQAAKVVEKAINDLIGKAGQGIYAKYEKEASDLLAELTDAADPAKLQALAERYPNAQVAARAMAMAAESFEKANQPRMASQVLRRLYMKYFPRFNEQERAKLLESMARAYMRFGNREAALARLDRAAGLIEDSPLTKPLLGTDGQPLKAADGQPAATFKAAVASLQQARQTAAGQSMPDVRIPLPQRGKPPVAPFLPADDKSVIAGVKALATTPRDLREMARFDRILAWSNTLNCYPAGQTTALWSSDALTASPMGAAWRGDRVLVWSAAEMAILDANSGKTLWRKEIKSLQAVDIVAGGAAREPDRAAIPDAEEGNVVAIRGQAILMRNRLPADPAMDQPMPKAGGPEALHHLRIVTDRIVATTTTGRTLAVAWDDGQVLWQSRIAARPLERLLVSDDFVIARFTEDNKYVLIVLDTFNGQEISRKSVAPNQPGFPLNMALAADGTLIYTTVDPQKGGGGIMARDLCEPGEAPARQKSVAGRTFNGTTAAEQMAIWGDQVFTVADGGQTIDRRSTRDFADIGAGGALKPMGDNSLRLYVSGMNLFAISSKSLTWYGLDHDKSESPQNVPMRLESRQFDKTVPLVPQDAIIAKDMLVVPGMVSKEGQGRFYSLYVYSCVETRDSHNRRAVSGLLLYGSDTTMIAEPAITQWQAFDGGIGYVTGDERLVLLKGARQ